MSLQLQKIAVVVLSLNHAIKLRAPVFSRNLWGLAFALLNLSKASFAVSIYYMLLFGNKVSILTIKSQEIYLDTC